MADPLSIAASITGIITAAVKITSVLSDLHDAPDHIADLSAEVNNIRIVFRAFQRLIDQPHSLPSHRAAMIQLEDVVVIVTEIVLVFSELETIVTPLAKQQRHPLRRLTWIWERPTTTRLVNQLQRHKSSLTVVLQIIACNSDIEAADAAVALQEKIEEQVAMSTDIAERLDKLQLSIEGQEIVEPETPLLANNESSNAQMHPDYQATLDEILENSTVYKRALHRSNNSTSSSSVVSRSWSIISGISMTQISVLAVLNLPLYDNEIERFRQLANVPDDDPPNYENINQGVDGTSDLQRTDSQATSVASPSGRRNSASSRNSLAGSGGAIRRINKELASMKCNPSAQFECGPLGDDMFSWQAAIYGPPNTPYAGGVFFVSIHLPPDYPLKTPKIRFTTRIYHPNISQNGYIDLDVLGESWNPSMTIAKVLSSLVAFLGDPFRGDRNNPDAKCLMPEIGRLYWTERERFNSTAREWTRKYAI